MSQKVKFVSFLISPDKKPLIKQILIDIKLSIKDLKLSKPQIGKIGGNLLITFKTLEEFYLPIKEEFKKHGIELLSTKQKNDLLKSNENSEEEVEEFVEKSWSDLAKEVNNIKAQPIEQYINKGDYKSIISLSKNIRLDPDYRKDAKKSISPAVTIQIGRLFQKGKATPEYAYESIDQLLRISSDKELKTLNEEDLQKEAALKAVELAKEFEENYYTLVLISNNHKIPAIGNIKAGIELAGICLSNKEKYDELINYAVEKLNTRWLQIALDAKTSSIGLAELNKVDTFITLVKNRRKRK